MFLFVLISPLGIDDGVKCFKLFLNLLDFVSFPPTPLDAFIDLVTPIFAFVRVPFWVFSPIYPQAHFVVVPSGLDHVPGPSPPVVVFLAQPHAFSRFTASIDMTDIQVIVIPFLPFVTPFAHPFSDGEPARLPAHLTERFGLLFPGDIKLPFLLP